jgi:hypothetical protein
MSRAVGRAGLIDYRSRYVLIVDKRRFGSPPNCEQISRHEPWQRCAVHRRGPQSENKIIFSEKSSFEAELKQRTFHTLSVCDILPHGHYAPRRPFASRNKVRHLVCMSFTRIRRINGHRYLYEEYRWREGGKIKSRSRSWKGWPKYPINGRSGWQTVIKSRIRRTKLVTWFERRSIRKLKLKSLSSVHALTINCRRIRWRSYPVPRSPPIKSANSQFNKTVYASLTSL